MSNPEHERIALHSGEYVNLLTKLPAGRMRQTIPLMRLKNTDRVIDFGCGAGLLALSIHKQVKGYVGIDFSPDFICEADKIAARDGLQNCTFHCASIVDYCELHPVTADVVAALDFSEHISDQDFVQIFNAAFRVLKPGGRLFIYTPNLGFFLERMKQIGVFPQFPQHIAVRDEKAHYPLLERCGFARDQISCQHPPHFNVLRFLHPLRNLPLVGPLFRAKLFLSCTK